MQTIWNPAALAIAAGLTFFGTDAAVATSVLLPPGSESSCSVNDLRHRARLGWVCAA